LKITGINAPLEGIAHRLAVTVAIVALALLGVGEHRVGLVDELKLRLSALFLVAVWVVL
jgi:hypothetical protein